jgi:hypothetical protein
MMNMQQEVCRGNRRITEEESFGAFHGGGGGPPVSSIQSSNSKRKELSSRKKQDPCFGDFLDGILFDKEMLVFQ